MLIFNVYIYNLLLYFYVFILVNADQIKLENNLNKNIKRNKLPEGFVLLDENVLNGPITTNRENDDGTKRNLYSMIRNEDDSFYYKYNEFNKLKNITSTKSEYFCELKSKLRTEVLKGYNLSCPKYYTIAIDKAFYGRYANDNTKCPIDITEENKWIIEKGCGYDPIIHVKYKCEGKSYCTIVPNKYFFMDNCWGIPKYLHIDYHCVKDKELKKERISILSFYDRIIPNTIQEHSVSELYQYANIHGYEFEFSKFNYIPERIVFFMKIQTIIDKLIEGLKYKKYDWIFWADNDVIIPNPNIKLESFLPGEKMNTVHIITAFDSLRFDGYDGINAGVLLIRVHEWSLNLFMRVMTYPYYNKEKPILYADQTSLNNILLEFDESDHYVIVPPEWFNNYYIQKGNFLYHIMGGSGEFKNKLLNLFLKNTKDDEEWYEKTNDNMRKEVLNYYNLSKDKRLKIGIQK